MLLILSVKAQAQVAATIHLPSHSFVAQGPLRLGQIAKVESSQRGVIEKLTQLPIGAAPRLGQSIILTKPMFAQWVKTYAGVDADQIDWRGQPSTVITTSERAIESSLIIKPARVALEKWLSERGNRASLIAHYPGGLQVPEGSVEFKVRPIAQAEIIQERIQVWVEIWVNQQFNRVVPVVFSFQSFQDALSPGVFANKSSLKNMPR